MKILIIIEKAIFNQQISFLVEFKNTPKQTQIKEIKFLLPVFITF